MLSSRLDRLVGVVKKRELLSQAEREEAKPDEEEAAVELLKSGRAEAEGARSLTDLWGAGGWLGTESEDDPEEEAGVSERARLNPGPVAPSVVPLV